MMLCIGGFRAFGGNLWANWGIAARWVDVAFFISFASFRGTGRQQNFEVEVEALVDIYRGSD